MLDWAVTPAALMHMLAKVWLPCLKQLVLQALTACRIVYGVVWCLQDVLATVGRLLVGSMSAA